MNMFGFSLSLVLLASSSCLAEVANHQQTAALDRDYSQQQPVTTFEEPLPATSYGSTFYPADSGFGNGNSFTTYSGGNNAVGGGGNFFSGLLNFSGDLLGTVLNIAFGLFFLSLILQIVTKLFESPLLEDLIWDKARSISEDDMLTYGNMMYNAYKRMENLNNSIPK